MATSHKKEHEVYNGVSTADVPNAGWGWSALSRTTVQVSGWVSVLIMLAFNFGNHEGHVETVWLLVLTALLVIGLLLHAFEPTLSTARTLTSHNKPVGHVEPDWAYDQKTLSGAYSNLTDGQLRALNIDPARVQHLRLAEGTSAGRHSLQAGSTASKAR